jgi:hypothetical protein
MNYERPGSQGWVSGAGRGAAALVSCLLLLAGCAGPSKLGPRSGETAAPGAAAVQPANIGAEPAAVGEHPEAGATGQKPRITFETDVHDFGEVGLLTKHVCEFRFKNTGTGVLTVKKKIDTVCGCTVPVLSRTQYAPGEEGTIQVTYTAGDSIGSTTKVLTVYSNDKTDRGMVDLKIQATVVERVAYEPKQLELRLKGPDANCPPITLRSLDHKSFAVTGILSNGSTLTAGVDPSRQATEFTLRPTLDPEQLQKHPMGHLVLALTHPECPEVRIPYQIVPEFQFTPSTVVLFNAEPNRPVMLEGVVLSNSYAQEFDVASYTSRTHRVRVMGKEKFVADDQASMGYRLRLGIVPPAASNPQGFFEDVLTVRLTNGKELQLPCRLFYRQSGG